MKFDLEILPRQTHVPPPRECSDSKNYLDWNDGNVVVGKDMVVRLLVITMVPNIVTCSDLHHLHYDYGLWITAFEMKRKNNHLLRSSSFA